MPESTPSTHAQAASGRLSEKVAIVTGAGRGIGRAIALRFAREGARVVLAARSVDQLQAVADEIGQDRALVAPTDVADADAVDALIRQTVDRFGGLDIVVNNAAATPFLGADAAAKAGLLGQTRVLAAELGPRGITVNAVLPSIVPDTRLAQDFLQKMGAAFGGITAEQSLNAFTQRAPLRRALTADEIANAVLFLASDEAATITAQSINVDAGTIVL